MEKKVVLFHITCQQKPCTFSRRNWQLGLVGQIGVHKPKTKEKNDMFSSLQIGLNFSYFIFHISNRKIEKSLPTIHSFQKDRIFSQITFALILFYSFEFPFFAFLAGWLVGWLLFFVFSLLCVSFFLFLLPFVSASFNGFFYYFVICNCFFSVVRVMLDETIKIK